MYIAYAQGYKTDIGPWVFDLDDPAKAAMAISKITQAAIDEEDPYADRYDKR
jgi:hypothetical protein